MNEMVNKLLLVRYKFRIEMHLGQPGFKYSALHINVDHLLKKIKK